MKIFSRLIDIILISIISVLIVLFCLAHQNYISFNKTKPESTSTNPTIKLSGTNISDRINKLSATTRKSILWINSNSSDDSFGSGFIVERNGKKYVLTNHHVIEGAKDVTAFLYGDKEEKLKVVGYDLDLDLAVLSFNKPIDLPALPLNKNRAKIGDYVLAIGHPLGLDYSVTLGIVSAKNRELELGSGSFDNLLQTDAAINPGNSGGPLFDLNGQVIGMNTAIMEDSQGLGFAITSFDINSILDELITNGKAERPYLGVHAIAIEKGLEVIETYDNAPSKRYGILPNDIFISIDGEKMKTLDDLYEYVNLKSVGDKIHIKLQRNGSTITKNVILGSKEEVLKK